MFSDCLIIIITTEIEKIDAYFGYWIRLINECYREGKRGPVVAKTRRGALPCSPEALFHRRQLEERDRRRPFFNEPFSFSDPFV